MALPSLTNATHKKVLNQSWTCPGLHQPHQKHICRSMPFGDLFETTAVDLPLFQRKYVWSTAQVCLHRVVYRVHVLCVVCRVPFVFL